MPAPVTKIAWSDDGALPAIGNANGELHCTAGVFFAIGHSAMVMSLAVLFSVVSVTVIGRAHWLEVTGSWLSILILLAIAAINIRALLGAQLRPVGAKTRLLPRVLRDARNPLVALPIGLLFGLGFETSSQLAAYGASLSSGGGAIAGAIIGVAFCAGLVVTDAIDGFLVHYIVAHRASGLPAVARLWLWIVTIFAIAVACYEIAPYLGFHANEQSDLTFGLSLIAVLVLSFAGVFIAIRVHSLRCRAPM